MIGRSCMVSRMESGAAQNDAGFDPRRHRRPRLRTGAATVARGCSRRDRVPQRRAGDGRGRAGARERPRGAHRGHDERPGDRTCRGDRAERAVRVPRRDAQGSGLELPRGSDPRRRDRAAGDGAGRQADRDDRRLARLRRAAGQGTRARGRSGRLRAAHRERRDADRPRATTSTRTSWSAATGARTSAGSRRSSSGSPACAASTAGGSSSRASPSS